MKRKKKDPTAAEILRARLVAFLKGEPTPHGRSYRLPLAALVEHTTNLLSVIDDLDQQTGSKGMMVCLERRRIVPIREALEQLDALLEKREIR